jgi:MFS family permease
MAILVRKRFEKHHFNTIGKMVLVGFLVSMGLSLIDTIWALYFDSFVHNASLVGFISGSLTFISLISYFYIIPFIEKSRKDKLYLFTLVVYAIAYILFAINKSFYIALLIAFVLTIAQTFRMTCFGLIIKDKSKKENLPSNEGVIYTFVNLAWLIGPLLAGFVADKLHLSFVFVLAGVFVILAAIIFRVFRIKDAHVKKKIDKDIYRNFIDFFKDKDRVVSYFVSGGVNFWWVLVYLFMPLYIVRNGLNDIWVGYFLFAAAFPLILTEYAFSVFAEKIGFKKTFMIGYLIVIIVSFVSFFTSNVFAVLVLISAGSFGMAMVEPTTEAYSLAQLSKEEAERFYGPYNTTADINGFIGKIIPSIILVFLPFNYIFIVFGIAMIIMFLLSFYAKEKINER